MSKIFLDCEKEVELFLLWLNVFLQVKHSCADLLEEWFSIAWLADTDDRNGNES